MNSSKASSNLARWCTGLFAAAEAGYMLELTHPCHERKRLSTIVDFWGAFLQDILRVLGGLYSIIMQNFFEIPSCRSLVWYYTSRNIFMFGLKTPRPMLLTPQNRGLWDNRAMGCNVNTTPIRHIFVLKLAMTYSCSWLKYVKRLLIYRDFSFLFQDATIRHVDIDTGGGLLYEYMNIMDNLSAHWWQVWQPIELRGGVVGGL